MNLAGQIAAWIVGWVAALTAIGVVARFMWRFAGDVRRVLDELMGQPPGTPGAPPEGRPGVIQRQRSTDEAVGEIKESLGHLGERLSLVESQLQRIADAQHTEAA